MEWIADDFRIVIDHYLLDGRVVITHLEEPRRTETRRYKFVENIFAMRGVARAYYAVRI